ncbi:MAG: protein kinase [Candidatus Micrarchaeota archaeon]
MQKSEDGSDGSGRRKKDALSGKSRMAIPLRSMMASEEPAVEGLAAQPDAMLQGARIDKTPQDFYLVEGILGEGGMGRVYRGRMIKTTKPKKGKEGEEKGAKTVINREVAIKVINFDSAFANADPANIEQTKKMMYDRFLSEVELVAKLKHPNIVDILDFGELDDGKPFCVMELLKGQDLDQVIEAAGMLPWDFTKTVAVQVCKALEAAHGYEEDGEKKPIIHRDIKPLNIFLLQDKEGEWVVKVLDFGLAKLLAPSSSELTLKGEGGFGTPGYMSPEQAWGLTMDERTDIYAVGAVLYHMLTGTTPFTFYLDKARADFPTTDEFNAYQHNKWNEFKEKLWKTKPKTVREVVPGADVSEQVEAIVMKCLASDPKNRFQSIKELKDAITALNGEKNANGAEEQKMPSVPETELPSVIISPGEPYARVEPTAPAQDVQAAEEDMKTVPRQAKPEAGADEAAVQEAAQSAAQPEPAMSAEDAARVLEQADLPEASSRYEKTEIVRIRDLKPKGARTDETAVDVAAPKRRRLAKFIAAGAALAVLGASGAYIVTRAGSHESEPIAQQSAKPPAANPGPPRARDPIPEPARTDIATPAPPAADAAPEAAVVQEHTITIRTGVSGVRVIRDGETACTTARDGSCALTIGHGSEPVELRLARRGYQDATASVVPDQDRTVDASMERAPTKVQGSTPQPHTPRITDEGDRPRIRTEE